ncbi:MAG: hypothetical protein AAFO01_07415 [Pseudomonadota bacterium]
MMMAQHDSRRIVVITAMALIVWATGASITYADDTVPSVEPIKPEDIPSVHNTFYRVPEGVVGWDILGVLDVKIEVLGPLQTNSSKTFSDEVRALDGEMIKVMGFLYPLEGGVTHDYFLLTAWPPSCPFCLPAGPAMMVETYASEAIDFTEGAIVMAGQFEVLDDDPNGFYYRMRSAELVERYDDIRWNGVESLQPSMN